MTGAAHTPFRGPREGAADCGIASLPLRAHGIAPIRRKTLSPSVAARRVGALAETTPR
jgi:hypothetical protein